MLTFRQQTDERDARLAELQAALTAAQGEVAQLRVTAEDQQKQAAAQLDDLATEKAQLEAERAALEQALAKERDEVARLTEKVSPFTRARPRT